MRKLLLLSVLVAGAAGLSGCFGSLVAAQNEAVRLEATLHNQMTQGDLAGIYNNADARYRQAVTRERSDALFSAIARKLGAPLDCKPEGINVNATTSGFTIRARCQTHFSKDATGDETFVWIKSGDQYRLLNNNINSNELIER